MKTPWIVLIFFLIFSCGPGRKKVVTQKNISPKGDTVTIECDSIFKEIGYMVRLVSFDSLLDEESNSILVFGQEIEGVLKQTFIDTLYSNVGQIEFLDYNKDGIKDILVQNVSDARSNWTYNLFLTDLNGKTLKKVKGFQEIKNPKLNKRLGIIESHVNSGTNYIELYKLLDTESIYKYDILIYDSLDEMTEGSYKKTLETIKEN